MKIGFDAKRLYNNFTGLGNYSRSLVKSLYSLFPENQYYLYTPKVKRNFETNSFLNSNDLITRVPGTKCKNYWRSYGIKNSLRHDNIDIYHGLSHEIPYGIKKTGIKSIVSIHDLIFKIYPETYKTIDRIIYDKKFRYACENADTVIAISESTKNDIIEYYNINPERIKVVYQSCSSLFNVLQRKEDIQQTIKKYQLPGEYLLYVGSIIKRKNIETIIKALCSLQGNINLPLVIVGRGNYKDQLIKLTQKLKVEDKIIWLSKIESNYELQAIYQQAQIFIYPSVYEGFGIPVVEAIKCKTPVITSSTSSLPEAGGPDCLYIHPKSHDELADHIKKILSDSSLRTQMIENSLAYIQNKFNEKTVTSNMMEVYNGLI